jgi:uncharacterized protein YkwD
MRRVALLLGTTVALFVLIVPADARGCRGADAAPTAATLHQARRAVLCLVNGERRRQGDSPLRTNAALQRSAWRYARAMVRESFFAHVTPSGLTFRERMLRETDYLDHARRWSIGENIAWGSGAGAAPAEIVKGWMESRDHRRILLDGSYREMGVGVAIGAPTELVGSSTAATYVNHFGRRG